MIQLSPSRLLLLSSFAYLASSAQAWTYTDNYNDTSIFQAFFVIPNSGGATTTYSAPSLAGDRYLHTFTGTDSRTSGAVNLMVGYSRKTTPDNILSPFFNPATDGNIGSFQLDIDSRFVTSQNGASAKLGLLLRQNGHTFMGVSNVNITNTSWQRLSTGTVAVPSFVEDNGSNSRLDLSPTGAPILVCVGYLVTIPDNSITSTVTIEFDNPSVKTGPVPEPSSLAVLSIAGLVGLGVRRKKQLATLV